MQTKEKKIGVSLIALIITIIVIVIISGAVILSLSQNNPIGEANEAVFKADLDAIKSDYNLYTTSRYGTQKSYNPSKLNANDLTATYAGKEMEDKTIKDIIPALKKTEKYNGQFEIIDGKLVYIGSNRTNKRWAQDINVEVIDADRLDAVVTSTITLPIAAGTDVISTVKYSSNNAINKINLNGKLELLDENNLIVPLQPTFEIGNPTGTDSETLRNVDIIIKTDLLNEGRYKLRLKPYSVFNIYDVTISKEIVTDILFEIDNTPPVNPIMLPSITTWTNGNVTLDITYPVDSIKNEYSLDTENWLVYINPLLITENNTTIYARAIDIAGNQSGQSSLTIANIDKELPIITYDPNGGENLQTINTKVTVVDIGNSNINATTLQYVWDTQNEIVPSIGWNNFTNGDAITTSGDEEYYLWVRASDNAGNMSVAKTNVFIGDITPPENPGISASPSGWTNGDVTVTITYPVDANIKEYSTNGTSWNTYSSPVVITTNNTTVYARATDSSGNQSGQSSITIANIDKSLPSVSFNPTGSVATNKNINVTVNGIDTGGSNIKRWRYRLSSNNGSTYGAWQGVNTGFTPTDTYTLPGGLDVPVLDGLVMNLTQNQNYMLEFDYRITSGSSEFNVDLWPDDLPEIHPTALATLQHYVWDNITSNSASMNASKLRIFNDIIRPNPADIHISNINLYPKGSHNILLDSTGEWKIQIEITDNAGNIDTITSNSYIIDKTPPTNPTMSVNTGNWTNGNVAVTITYPSDAAIKEYSTNGTTWNAYTGVISISSNLTVYARATDASGNQSGQSTLTISNIDKTAPSVPSVNFNGYTHNTWTAGDILLNLSSTDNASGINRYQWSGDRVTWHDFQSAWLYNYDTAQTTCFRVVDNAGNVSGPTEYYTILRDKTAPTATSYELKNVTSSGYDVYVYGVGDAGSGVNRVQFPTWTLYNNQDDIQPGWGSNPAATGQNLGGGTWYYRVNVTDHNKESGEYATHVYLYDNLGNAIGLSNQPNVIVPTAISYGSTIQDTYANIYLNDDPKNPFDNKFHNYDTLYNGNYHSISSLRENMRWFGGEDISVNRQCVDGTYSARVYSGNNTIPFTRNSNLNRWISVWFWAGGWTTNVYISNFRLNFADGSVLTPSQAVTNGYIEPLVLMASSAYSTSYNGLWTNFLSLRTGGSTSTQNFPSGTAIFKVKNKSPLSSVSIYSNTAFSSSYDGVVVFECVPTTEISITPF